MVTFCPLKSRNIKGSRAPEWRDQVIKDNFQRSRFLIPVANASTADAYVTTPCICPHQSEYLKLCSLPNKNFSLSARLQQHIFLLEACLHLQTTHEKMWIISNQYFVRLWWHQLFYYNFGSP